MSRTIFVSGAGGNIGRELIKQLVQKGAAVRAGAHSERSASALTELGAEAVTVDLGDTESIRVALTGVERAFSLSPLVPNLGQLGVNFVEAAKLAGVEYIVRASALGAGSPPAMTFSDWHREAERAVEDSGIPYTIVRPAYFMQNYVAFGGATVRAGDAFYLPHGDGAISSIDARDVAAVAATVLTEDGHDGRAYDLTGPEALSNHEVAEILSRLTGRTIDYVDVPEDAARQSLTATGLPASVVEGLLELAAIIRAGHLTAVTPTVEHITGRPATSFERFAKSHLEAFAHQAKAA